MQMNLLLQNKVALIFIRVAIVFIGGFSFEQDAFLERGCEMNALDSLVNPSVAFGKDHCSSRVRSLSLDYRELVKVRVVSLVEPLVTYEIRF